MKNKNAFSPSAIAALTEGSLNDPFTPGLSVKVKRNKKPTWKYMRWIPAKRLFLRRTLGTFPTMSIALARETAGEFNKLIESGADPRDVEREKIFKESMTVDRAHDLYMRAVSQGRHLSKSRMCKKISIRDKKYLYDLKVKPEIGQSIIYDVTEENLIRIVARIGKVTPFQANRVISELKIFFGWAASLRGLEIGLKSDPSKRLCDLRHPEPPRSRILNSDELGLLLRSISIEPDYIKRPILLYLLTAVRRAELTYATFSELDNDVWVLPADRVKNSRTHRIPLGPWALRLFLAGRVSGRKIGSNWVFPSDYVPGPQILGWQKILARIRLRMSGIAGFEINNFRLHDLRRTLRSNTKRLGVDYETAEAMLNHSKKGLSLIYDLYDLESEKRAAFLLWEREIIALAQQNGVADQLYVPENDNELP